MLQMLVYRRISWYHPQFLASSTQVGLSRIWWFSQHWSSIFIEDFPARHVGWVNHHFNPTRFPWYSYDIPMIFLWYSHDHPMIFPWSSEGNSDQDRCFGLRQTHVRLAKIRGTEFYGIGGGTTYTLATEEWGEFIVMANQQEYYIILHYYDLVSSNFWYDYCIHHPLRIIVMNIKKEIYLYIGSMFIIVGPINRDCS